MWPLTVLTEHPSFAAPLGGRLEPVGRPLALYLRLRLRPALAVALSPREKALEGVALGVSEGA